MMEGGGLFGVAGGSLGRLGAPQQPPAEDRHTTAPTQRSRHKTAPTPKSSSQDSTDPKISPDISITFTSSNKSFVRTQNQLQKQHKGLRTILQGASVTRHTILLGVSGSIKKLGLHSQRAKKLASKLHVHSINYAAKFVHARHAFSSTITDSHQEPVSGQACSPPNPRCFFLCSLMWKFYGKQYQACSPPW